MEIHNKRTGITPGLRLRRARRMNGHKTRHAFCEHLRQRGLHLAPHRLGRIERGANPTLNELRLLSTQLQISLDWLLLGDDAPAAVITRRLRNLPKEARRALLRFIDLLRSAIDDPEPD